MATKKQIDRARSQYLRENKRARKCLTIRRQDHQGVGVYRSKNDYIGQGKG